MIASLPWSRSYLSRRRSAGAVVPTLRVACFPECVPQ
jgi:hypothetical protein